MVWSDCVAAKVKGLQTQPHLKGLLNVLIV